MNPVTGPFSKSWEVIQPSANGPYPTHVGSRTWYRQKPPYSLALSYNFWSNKLLAGASSGDRTPGTANADFNGYGESTYDAQAYNKAYERFVDKAKTTADWAVTLIERRKSVDMITARLKQLTSFAVHVRRFQFGAALGDLGLATQGDPRLNWRKLKKDGRSLGSNWLEYSFGWKPLIGDIYSSIDILQQEIKPLRITTSASVKPGLVASWAYDDGYVASSWRKRYEVSKRIGAEIEVSNPNLFLANQLGLINPASVLWELTPWSFVVDWFSNVGTVLGSLTDFHGLTLNNSYVSHKSTRTYSETNSSHYSSGPQWFKNYTAQRVEAYRSAGSIPGPSLIIRQPWQLQPGRAANAAALLLQKLR